MTTAVHRSTAGQSFAERNREARQLLQKYALAATGIGAIPLPLVDLVAVTWLQVAMVRRLCTLYALDYKKQRVANWVSSLVNGVATVSLGFGKFSSLLKAMPIIGAGIGTLTMPIISGASTYALGIVFIQHFDSGGTLLTFEPEKVRAHYLREAAAAQAAPAPWMNEEARQTAGGARRPG